MTTPTNRGQSPISNPASESDLATMLRMSSGVIVWALHFAVVYGFTALACARGFGATAPWVVGAATLVAAAGAAVIIVRNFSREFTRWMSAAVAAAGLVAILWEGLSVLMVPACA
jgi:hypothetical protein